ncbi:MAG: glycosyl transferase [Candidatus Lokiarchaeota archaeon]|nr:glycosyl transferase [Candidatus Lokiarchaeota archaeon]
MKYGYFSVKDREYIITRPDTPTPWINYLNNGKYCAMISNTGGGFSFYIDPKSNRILRYRYNNIPVDRPGRYLYLRDRETSEYWSPTWQPTMNKLENYRCTHGLGYTKISSSYQGISSEILYFVPINDNLEIWMLTVKNETSEQKNLDLFSYAEFCLWDAENDQIDLQYSQNIAVSKYDEEQNAIIYHLFSLFNGLVFFYSSNNIDTYDGDRDAFIGNYRSEENPISVEKGVCSNSIALGGNPIAATSSKISLNPNETKKVIFLLGITQEKSKIKDITSKYNNIEKIESSLEELKKKWSFYLDKYEINTPDEDFNLIVNTWNPYQCKMTFDWARYVSFYETGIGRGIGFRDFNQDSLGVCNRIPEQVRQRLLIIAETQFESGKVYHLYYPLTNKGDFPNYTNTHQFFFGDDHLWMIFAVSNYLKETGDLSILKQDVAYVEGSKGDLYEHLKKAIEFTKNNIGPHGFPLIGTADWNDTLQLHGPNKHGESVMIAMQYHKALLDLSDIAQELGMKEDSLEYINLAKDMKEHLNSKAWDGKWYIRAYDDNGSVLGSHKNNEGKIFLNTQSWAVYSGITSENRALQCMNSVRENLVTDYGIKLLNPPYTHYYPEMGGITTFPPGLKENGSIFSHTNPWVEIAECILGRGNYAYEYYKKIAPTTKNNIAEIHMTEPYVFSQMITGNNHPKFGKAKNSWLTGTAAWTLKAATDWILGIRSDFNGLLIDPCIPTAWNGFSIMRHFRNSIYNINVQNPQNISKGIQEISIDNKTIEGNLIPIFNDNKKHNVIVKMGK